VQYLATISKKPLSDACCARPGLFIMFPQRFRELFPHSSSQGRAYEPIDEEDLRDSIDGLDVGDEHGIDKEIGGPVGRFVFSYI
jgi:hypothetical protein